MHVLKTKGNASSRTQNTPRKSREGNLLIFSKEEQTIVSDMRFLHKLKKILEKNQPDDFKL